MLLLKLIVESPDVPGKLIPDIEYAALMVGSCHVPVILIWELLLLLLQADKSAKEIINRPVFLGVFITTGLMFMSI